MTRTAFIGMGTMGSPMAQNQVRASLTVQAWNRTQEGRPLVTEARENGVLILPTIKEALQDADVICICVGDVKDVNGVIFDEGGIAENAKKGAIVIDFSTIGTKAVKEIAQKLKAYDLSFMDAPISGGDLGARNGTLTIMVGGNETDFAKCLPIFQTMGKNIIYCGEVGSGQAVKLCNQVLCAIHMIALCEATKLAQNSNLDPHLMREVCSTGAAGSWALSNLGDKVAEGDFEPGFMVKHILKDLRLVQESLGDNQLPGITLADKMFKVVRELDGAEQGTQAMIRAYE